MSQAGSLNGGGSGPTPPDITLTGNVGPPQSPTDGNFDIKTDSSTFVFTGDDSTLTLDFSEPNHNFAIGTSLPALAGGVGNTIYGGLGAGNAITTAGGNVILGARAAENLTAGQQSIFIGVDAGRQAIDVGSCVAIGHLALSSLSSTVVTGYENVVAIGYQSLTNLVSGYNQIAIGAGAGNAYTSNEAGNICIDNTGSVGESFVTRIGSNQTKAFMAGIDGVTVAGSAPVGIDTNDQLSSLGFGSAGEVLTSNGALISPTWQPGGGGGSSITYTGNSGGALSPATNLNVRTSSSTFVFTGSGSTLTLGFSNTNSNFAIGTTMPARTTGSQNFIYGNNGSGNAISSGNNNYIFGAFSGVGLNTGSGNVFIGTGAGQNATASSGCVAIGESALRDLTVSSALGFERNTAIGNNTLSSLTSGYGNSVFGESAGSAYTSNEIFNLCFGSPGVAGESNTTRIGNGQTSIYLAGSNGAPLANSGVLLVNNATRLSSAGQGTAGQVLTSNGSGTTPTWQAPITATVNSSFVGAGSAIALPSGTPTNVTSLTLGVGTWLINGIAQFAANALNLTSPRRISVSSVSGAHTALGNTSFQIGYSAGISTDAVIPVTGFVLTFAAPTTIYLVASVSFSAGGAQSVYGRISANRIS